MRRRQFFQASAVTAGLAVGGQLSHAAVIQEPDRQVFELRKYHCKEAEQQAAVLNYLSAAALPAWKRLEIGPVGVWTEVGKNASHAVHVLLVSLEPDQLLNARYELEGDAEYLAAATEYLAKPKSAPAFERVESSLLAAFKGMPKLAVPSDKASFYELRLYESHSEAKARRKIEMFNSGEIAIFKKAGFEPVFFGETLIGPRIPNLQYMLASESKEANAKSWEKFTEHPDWLAMKDLPKYAETVSKIARTYLTPADFSQI